MQFEKHQAPLPDRLTDELVGLWESVFETSYHAFRAVLRGSETAHNTDLVYVYRQGERVVGTCHLTIPKALPEIAGLGEVATAADFRRRGIGHRLCEALRDDFQRAGGRAVFLGTANPAAERLYRRLGWLRIPGSNVMAYIAARGSPEAFLDRFFEEGEAAAPAEGSSADRVPMIPLAVYPHKQRVLDANAEMYSTRYSLQPSCMGLYPRYEAVAEEGRGAWFSARTAGGKTVGLSTARLGDPGAAQIDAFAHSRYTAAWEDLAEAALAWSVSRGVASCSALVSEEDEEKLAGFARLGFRTAGPGLPIGNGPGKAAWRTMVKSLV